MATESRPEVYGGIVAIQALNNLNSNWRPQLIDVIRSCARYIPLKLDDDPTSCENDLVGQMFPTVIVEGETLVDQLPWVDELYRGLMLNVVRNMMGPQVNTRNVHVEITANIVGSGMRGQAHKDYAEPSANLYIQEPSDYKSGYLIVAGNKNAGTYNKIVTDTMGATIYPKEGTISVVRAQEYPHVISVVNRSVLDRSNELEEPDLSRDAFWKEARLSLNFNYSDEVSLRRAAALGFSTEQMRDFIHGNN